MIYLGIDLGTTYSLAAYINDHGNPTLFPDRHDVDSFRTPSVVHISDEGCFVGNSVEEILDDEPELPHARFFKLAMGNKESAYSDDQNRPWWPQGLSALILKKLLADVESFSSEDIGGAVIAVPANFSDSQRRATCEAAQLAGIANIKLIEEPVAAATFYGHQNQGSEKTIFVYDLGGGTFDASILQLGDSGLFALATEGSNRLGGMRIDEIIMRHISEEFIRQHGFEPQDASSQAILRRFANQCKLTLVKPGKSKVSKTLVLSGKTLDFVLSRERFNQLINDFVDDTIAVCKKCLDSAGLDWPFIDSIMLTGGSSLLPLVAQKLSHASMKPVDRLECKQPHQAVAYGAAMLAKQLFRQQQQKQLQSICSYDLGIRIKDKNGQPGIKVLIAQNTAVPASNTMTFYTNRDEQKRIIIEAVQQRQTHSETAGGEHDISLGFFAFGIENPRKNYPLEITFSYDLEGMVTITAKDPETNKAIKQVMDEDTSALDKALLAQQDWIRHLKINQ